MHNYSQPHKYLYHKHQPQLAYSYPLNNINYDYKTLNSSQSKYQHKFLPNTQSKNKSRLINQYIPISDTNQNKNQLFSSLKQKSKIKYFQSIHGLIANARQKKLQIQQLLIKQQEKAQQEDREQSQINISLKKLRKVVRLLGIVCKIILGSNQHNSYMELPSQDVSLRDMQSFSMQMYQRQMNEKNCQIQRLKKLVQILNSVNHKPNHKDEILQQSMIISKHSSINIVNNSITKEDFNVPLEIFHQFNQNVNKIYQSLEVQTERIQQNSTQIENKSQVRKGKFKICQEYSVWNILDGITIINRQNQEKLQQKIVKQQQNLVPNIQDQLSIKKATLNLSNVKLQTIHVHSRCQYLKRFKSILKIAINSINLSNNILFKIKKNSQAISINEKILQISNFFNQQYAKKDNNFNDDQFYKLIKQKITQTYERVYNIYKVKNFDFSKVECF